MRTGTTDLTEVLPTLALFTFDYLVVGGTLLHFASVAALLLQVAVLLKAAQWFFYPWLLDAMEAPVPISAQLHSSTLVVIGFYLFFRFQGLFSIAPIASVVFVVAGMLTSVGASILGFFQLDGKKLLACSTAGQLGYVLVSLGLELYNEALILLIFCCCNKAMAFVLFGVLMRRFSGLSDFRVLGGSVVLAWFEHAFLLTIIFNFTVFPGIFC
jgi:NADH:ubiquinone oxidoreductase subunit 5 (subunit L)/multisubunit Na+/H+ antiporter MnhA subunit